MANNITIKDASKVVQTVASTQTAGVHTPHHRDPEAISQLSQIKTSLDLITKYVPVTKANTNLLDGACDGLLIGTAGTINLMQPDGTIRDGLPVLEGYHPISTLQVRTGGTANNVWALY